MQLAARVGSPVIAVTPIASAQQLQWSQSPLNGHWYAVSVANGTWCGQEALAIAIGGHLATVRSQQEQDWLTGAVGTGWANLGIGASDVQVEGTWAWSSGEQFDFVPNNSQGWDPWNTGEPNNGPITGQGLEHYAYLVAANSWRWNDACSCVGCAPSFVHPGVIELESDDCDGNLVPDLYEIYAQPSLDIDGNHVLDACQPLLVYCTASTTTHGCTPQITGTGTASASQSSGFTISVAGVEGQKNGLIFYGISPTAVAWAIGNTSYVCVAPPVQRTPITNAGGTLASCDGVLALDFNTYMAANPTSLGGPFAAGQEFYAQGWFRDPGAVKGTNLSNGLRFRLSP